MKKTETTTAMNSKCNIPATEPDKKATLFNDTDGESYHFTYTSIKELMEQAFHILFDNYDELEDEGEVLVTLEDENISFWWIPVYAHYALAKGRISEEQAFLYMTNPQGDECAESVEV